jgi:ABC-type amino acid transport substrate-binding protein
LEVDLARELADAIKRDHRLRQLPEGRLIDALRGGRIDLMFSELPPAELEALGLTGGAPVLGTGQMAVVRNEDFDQFPRLLDLKLTGARVGYVRGSLGARLVHEKLVNAERVPVSSADEGLAALRAGGIDIFIHDAATAWLLAANPQETELSGIFRPLSQAQLRIVTRSEDQTLRREIDRVLDAWRRSGELQRLVHRWIPVQIRVGEHVKTRGLPARRSSDQAAPSPVTRRGTI